MFSKLGFHVDLMSYPNQIYKMIMANPSVIKVISAMGLLRILHEQLPRTKFIARDWNVGDDFLRFGGHIEPENAAYRWFKGMESSIKQAPFAYWESFNEMSSEEHLVQYALFEAERIRIMHLEGGYKCCVGNFAGGTPQIVDPEDRWPLLYPMLEVANAYDSVLGLHEYGGMWLDMWYGPNSTGAVLSGQRHPFPEEYSEGWLFGRYRKVYNKHIRPNGWHNIRIVLTEFGLDRAATEVTARINPNGQATGPWTQCREAWAAFGRPDSEQFYTEQLQWADRQMQKDAYVYGATIFTWGTLSDVWRKYDIEGGVSDRLVEYMSKLSQEPEPTPEPDPIPESSGEPHEPEIPQEGDEMPDFKLRWPTDFRVVTQHFGNNPQWYSRFGLPGHEGIDIRAPFGSNIYAGADGVVYLVETGTGPYGTQVRIDHQNGFKTVYAHLYRAFVKQGQTVRAGDRIGLADSTGNSTGSHLHLSLKKAGATARRETNMPGDLVDPWPYLNEAIVGTTLLVTADIGLRVRSGPGFNYAKITVLPYLSEVETLEDEDTLTRFLGKPDFWIQVRLENNTRGWCYAQFLTRK